MEAELNLATVLHSQGKLTAEKQAYYAAKNNDLGVARKLAGDYQTAIAYYQQAIALQPDLTIAHYNLGVALDLKGAPEEANTCYQTVLNLSTNNPSIYSQVAAQRLQKIDQLSQLYGLSILTSKKILNYNPYCHFTRKEVTPGSII